MKAPLKPSLHGDGEGSIGWGVGELELLGGQHEALGNARIWSDNLQLPHKQVGGYTISENLKLPCGGHVGHGGRGRHGGHCGQDKTYI